MIIMDGHLTNGKVLFSHTNLILTFSIEKNRSFVRRLRSEADKPFSFRTRIQGGGGSVSVWGAITVEGVGSLAF